MELPENEPDFRREMAQDLRDKCLNILDKSEDVNELKKAFELLKRIDDYLPDTSDRGGRALNIEDYEIVKRFVERYGGRYEIKSIQN